jgi:hypothetical protein
MRSACDASVLALLTSAALGFGAPDALAQPAAPSSEPSHGRVDGDLTVVVGAGAAVAPQGVRAEGELRLRYLETAGLFATYEEAALFEGAADPQRVLALGSELRPLFLARWLQGYESHRARLDLALDSLGLELAAVFAQRPGGLFGSELGLQAGLGIEVPLLEQPSGPWIGLHGGVRWSDAALASGVVRGAVDRAGFLAVTLAWHELVVAHLVDVGDEAPR